MKLSYIGRPFSSYPRAEDRLTNHRRYFTVYKSPLPNYVNNLYHLLFRKKYKLSKFRSQVAATRALPQFEATSATVLLGSVANTNEAFTDSQSQ